MDLWTLSHLSEKLYGTICHIGLNVTLGKRINTHVFIIRHMGPVMTKPVFAICEKQRRRSACASAQSDQRLYCRCIDSIIPLVSISEISNLCLRSFSS